MRIINVDKEYFNSKRGINICYHYTSTEALISIISSNSLRFTHCGFLNDIEEYNYIFNLLEDEELKNCDTYDFIKRIIEEAGKDNKNLIYLSKNKNRNFYNVNRGDYFVFSTSSNDDSLPMWSYYSKNGNYYGYSIKLDISKIASELKNENGDFLYGRVIYDRKEQVQIIKAKTEEIIKRLDSQLGKNDNDDMCIDEAQNDLFSFIQMIRIFFKRSGFQHENEVRIALLTNPSDTLKVGYNSINGLIRPYIEYYFENHLPIKGIKMSPSIEFESARRGLQYLLEEKGYYTNQDIKDSNEYRFISKSEIRLRY